ncbi:MAG TPA: transcription antitermination factor NusB [Gemmatimonadales bacterium]|nr:transcription antitermination factor NusB [Gemmatimonadales bacterium]
MPLDGLAPRRAALSTLKQVRAGTPFEAALDRAVKRLPEQDRRLVHELAAGVLRRQSALDAQLTPLVPRGWDGVAAELKEVLRLGAYQLTALDRIPPHAAVDTSVALAKEAGGARAGGFVNAVLRKVGREAASRGGTVKGAPRDDGVEPSAGSLARDQSHPAWLVERWLERFGAEGTAKLLDWNNTRPRLVLQPARATLEELSRRWSDAGIEVTPAPFGAGLVTGQSRPQALPGYDEGGFIVQDPAQSLLTRYADLPPGATIYDACAAPGGKTIALGRRAGRVVAADSSRPRVRRLAGNLRRAGSGHEHAVVADARQAPIRPTEAVLVDAPCLGTGTFARHPDARWRVTPQALGALAERQAELLEQASTAVAPGGLLVYSTCSIEPEENGQQVDSFLARHPEFRREPSETFPPTLLSPEGDMMILPQQHHMDGAYAARLRRSA